MRVREETKIEIYLDGRKASCGGPKHCALVALSQPRHCLRHHRLCDAAPLVFRVDHHPMNPSPCVRTVLRMLPPAGDARHHLPILCLDKEHSIFKGIQRSAIFMQKQIWRHIDVGFSGAMQVGPCRRIAAAIRSHAVSVGQTVHRESM